MSAQAPTDCEICGSPVRHCFSIQGFEHYRCTDCSHLFVFPKPTQLHLDRFYEGGRFYDKADTEQERLLKEAASRLKWLNQHFDPRGLTRRLLDIGCAKGYFLKSARDAGWQVTGLDRSAGLVKQAREFSGAEVVAGLLEEIDQSVSGFSVVTAWEVIEHSRDPRLFMSSLVKRLEGQAIVAFSTPLANGLPAKVLGSRFPMLIPPEHLSLFTRRSLRQLAAEFGLEEIAYRSFSNLGAASLASGLSILLFHRRIGEVGPLFRGLVFLAAISVAWLPRLIDKLGWGSEMEVIFRRRKT